MTIESIETMETVEGSSASTEAPKSAEETKEKTNEPEAGESVVSADAGADPVDGSVPNGDAKDDDQDSKKGEGGPPSEGGAARRGKRVRKSIDNYTVEEKPRKEIEIPNGRGEKLEQMPNVVANFKAITWSDPHLQDLYTIVFGRGKKKNFKEHLLQFNGVVHPEGKEEEAKEKILAKMYKLKMNELKAVMDLADIDRSADGDKGTPGKEELCQKFLDWLEAPKASGKSGTSAGKKKKGKRKSGSSKKATPAKKARKITPSKTSAKGEKSPTKTATPNTKKAAAKPKKAKSPKAGTPTSVVLNIPGADTEKIREKVKDIVESADKATLTVKGVRKILEDWLDEDLTDHKDAIRSIVMEVM